MFIQREPSVLDQIEFVIENKIREQTTVRTKVTSIPSEYIDIANKSTVVVQFISREYSEPANKGRMPSFRQEVTYSYRVRVIFRELRTHKQAYPLVETVERTLNNSPCVKEVDSNFSNIWLTKTSFVEREDDTCWVLDIELSFASIETSCTHV